MGQIFSLKNKLKYKIIFLITGLTADEFECANEYISQYEDTTDFEDFDKFLDKISLNPIEGELKMPLDTYNKLLEEQKEAQKKENEEIEKAWLPDELNDLYTPFSEFKKLPIEKQVYISIIFQLAAMPLVDGKVYTPYFDQALYELNIKILNKMKDRIPFIFQEDKYYSNKQDKYVFIIKFTAKNPDIRKEYKTPEDKAKLKIVQNISKIYARILKNKPLELYQDKASQHVIEKLGGKVSYPWYGFRQIMSVNID